MLGIRSIFSKATSFRSATLCSIRRKMATSPEGKVAEAELPKKWIEVEIKMPWGIVAGKLWNPNNTQPILAMHGWQENAGAFDHLIPLLPEKTSVLAIDLPGHGLSSWYPKGMQYSEAMSIQTIHRIRRHFGWEKIAFIGHSMSSKYSFLYSILFPQDIKFVVTLDYFKLPYHIGIKKRVNKAAQALEYYFHLDDSKKPRAKFTEEQTVRKIIEANENSLDESACRTLMIRGFTKNSDGTVSVNRDPRVKINHSLVFGDECLEEQAELVKSPYMLLKSTEWLYTEKKNNFFQTIDALRKNSPDVRFHDVQGTHHFHMMRPESVAELIIPFIEKYN